MGLWVVSERTRESKDTYDGESSSMLKSNICENNELDAPTGVIAGASVANLKIPAFDFNTI